MKTHLTPTTNMNKSSNLTQKRMEPQENTIGLPARIIMNLLRIFESVL